MLRILVFALIYFIVFILIEFTSRKLKIKSEVSRRFAHLISGLVTIFLPYYLDKNQIIILAIIISISLMISRAKSIFQSIHGVKRPSFGEFFFPLAVIAAALLFLPETKLFFVFSILVMTISDVSANFFGTKYKYGKLLFGKTFSGSLAFFFTTFVIALFFLNFWQSIILALFISVIENVSPLGSDNLTIVCACYIAITILT